jgi:hypothetical protein
MDRHDLFPTEELIADYRRIFTGRGSEDVIMHILYDYGVFVESDTPEDVVLRNQGIRLLNILGGGEIDRETIRIFIKALVRQPVKKEKKKE